MAANAGPRGDKGVTDELTFGWVSPVIGLPDSNNEPIVMYQERNILPTAFQHFDCVWLADHFYGFANENDPFLESWTTMTWLAAKFPTVKLCHHVMGQGYRNPALTAKMASTLQALSGGRFILGIGAGWRGEEFERYGYEFPSTATRIRQLEETIQICRLMWTEESPSFEGRYYTIKDAKAPPRPDPMIPIMEGAQGEQLSLPMVGRQADGWNTFWWPTDEWEENWTRKRDIVLKSAEEAGRDPSDITISVPREVGLPNNSQESEAWREVLERFRELGVRHFTCDFGHPTSTEPVLRFVEEVMNPMREA